MTYMSFYPQALTRVLLTGGLPPVSPGCSAEGVYRACFQQAKKQTQKFYARFPQDEAAIRAVVLHVHAEGPSGVRRVAVIRGFLYKVLRGERGRN